MIYKDKENTIVSLIEQDLLSTIGYCIFIGGNIVSRKSKKQNMVAWSNAEVEYRRMTSLTCELVWIKQFLQEL